MKLWPSSATCCPADRTLETAMLDAVRSGRRKRAKMIFHYRGEDNAVYWHWSDQVPHLQPTPPANAPDMVSAHPPA